MNGIYDILMSDDVSQSIKENFNYLVSIIPEIKYMVGFPHNHPQHHLNVWDHTLLALSLSEKDFDIRLCLLLHDIGKPFSYQDEEVRHFRNHAKVSANMSKEILYRLGFDEEYINYMVYLILHHDTKISDEQINNDYDLCLKLLKVQKADAFAHHPDKLDKRKEYFKIMEDKLSSKKR